VTAGGAQDLKFARNEIGGGRIPHPDAITAEGLLGEHDLTLPPADDCRQFLRLVGEATVADLPTLPHARAISSSSRSRRTSARRRGDATR
jgi:Ca-activated chloride channel family protein